MKSALYGSVTQNRYSWKSALNGSVNRFTAMVLKDNDLKILKILYDYY